MISAKTARYGCTPSFRRKGESPGRNVLHRRPWTSVCAAFAGVTPAPSEGTSLALYCRRELQGIRPR